MTKEEMREASATARMMTKKFLSVIKDEALQELLATAEENLMRGQTAVEAVQEELASRGLWHPHEEQVEKLSPWVLIEEGCEMPRGCNTVALTVESGGGRYTVEGRRVNEDWYLVVRDGEMNAQLIDIDMNARVIAWAYKRKPCKATGKAAGAAKE